MTYPPSFCPETCITPSPDLGRPLRSRNPTLGHPTCRNCTLLETSTADGCSCLSQLGWQPPAPTRQPCSSGVLRKERISEDFNAGLSCLKFSLFLLPPAQPMEAGGLRCGLQPGTAPWGGHILSLTCSLTASTSGSKWLIVSGCTPRHPDSMGMGAPGTRDSQPTLSSAM